MIPRGGHALIKHLMFHTWSIACVILCVCIAYPGWLLQTNLSLDDLTNLNAPQRILLSWFYQHGQLPLWNPFNFGGQPFLAAGQSGALYLPNIVFLLMPFPTAFATSYLFHELLAAVGTYLLVWHITRSRLSAVTSSVAFVTCGFLMGHQVHTQMFDAMCWLPLCFYTMLCTLRSRSTPRPAALGLALCFALEIYAGHPQVTFYIGFTLLFYLVLHWFQNRRTGSLRGSLWVLAALVLGLGLSTPQWLPTLNLVEYSSRANEGSSFLLKGSFPAEGIFQLFSPFTAGGGFTGVDFSSARFQSLYHNVFFWEYLCYTGLIIFILALTVAIREFRHMELVRNLTIIGLVAWVLSYGQDGPLSFVLMHVPGFDLFRIPARYMGIFDFCSAVLAGICISRLQVLEGPACRGFLIRMRSVSGVLLLIWVGLRLCTPLSSSPWPAFAVPALLLLFTMILASVKRGLAFGVSALSAIAIVDVTLQAAWFSTFPMSTQAAYRTPSPVVKYIEAHVADRDPFTRVATLEASSLSHDQATAFQIPSLNGYDSLEPAWYADTINLTWSAETLFRNPRSNLDRMGVKYVITQPHNAEHLPTRTVGLQHWSHTWQRPPVGTSGILLVMSAADNGEEYGPLCTVTLTSGSHTYEQTLYGSLQTRTSYVLRLPRNWPQNRPIQVSLHNESWRNPCHVEALGFTGTPETMNLTSANMDLTMGPAAWQLAFEDGDEEVWTNPDSPMRAWVLNHTESMYALVPSHTEQISWTPNKQTWKVTSDGGWWVLSQTFDPNWGASVDGSRAAIARVGDVLTGVFVGPGTHVVTLQYRPRAFSIGIVVAFVAFCVWVGLLSYSLRLRLRLRH